LNEFQFKDLSLGQNVTFKVEITREMVEDFIKISKDINPLHTNKEYANSLGYKDIVVHGCLTNSFVSQLVGMHLPGKYCLILSINSSFLAPVFVSDILIVNGEVGELNESTRTAIIKIKMTNQDFKVVLKSKVLVRLEK